MSYNISRFHLQTVWLELPRDFDFLAWVRTLPDRDGQGSENTGKLWLTEKDDILLHVDMLSNTWELELLNQSMRGHVRPDALVVTDLDWNDEFSGILYDDILLPLFEQFKGTLTAVVVWESGDKIQHLLIQDGLTTEKDLLYEEA